MYFVGANAIGLAILAARSYAGNVSWALGMGDSETMGLINETY